MKQSSILLIFCVLISTSSAFGQNEASSKHQFSFYVNEKEKPAKKVKISVVVSGDTIESKSIDGLYYFPLIDTSKKFDILISVNKITFYVESFPSWMLNKGSKIIFGKLTKLKNLISIAEYNSLNETDKDWVKFSKRFFVVNRNYTLDIENVNTIKELQYLIINPTNSGKLLTTQRVVR